MEDVSAELNFSLVHGRHANAIPPISNMIAATQANITQLARGRFGDVAGNRAAETGGDLCADGDGWVAALGDTARFSGSRSDRHRAKVAHVS
jgi:hypothetical protein